VAITKKARIVRPLNAPQQTLGNLDAEAAARVLMASSDVALVMDGDGTIRGVTIGSDDVPLDPDNRWIGKRWIDVVTGESRPKVEALLKDAAEDAAPRWRQLNHPVKGERDVPVLYSTIQVGKRGRVVALGRDLRTVSALQQTLMDTQRSMEREYSRLRHAETRYRLLFQLASEAVLIVNAASLKVVEVNPTAMRLLNDSGKRGVVRTFPYGFDADGQRAVGQQIATLKAAGRADDVVVRSVDGKQRHVVSVSLFRHEAEAFCLVRLLPLHGDPQTSLVTPAQSRLLRVVERLPDGLVVTDLAGKVLTANLAFLDLAQLGSEEQARGESLALWLGRPGVDLEVLLSNLRQHNSVRQFSTTVRGQYGTVTKVEIAAVAVPDGDPPCLGFTVRNTSHLADGRATEVPRSIEHFTEMIGRVPLKDLVRDTTDAIERLCIEAALELTNDNRASAAEMLGLSRQSLYVKLRRYGMADETEGESAQVDPNS
jgi:transcriptional regulator PpsR